MQRKFYYKRKQVNIKKKLIQLMTITELVLLILNFTSCIVCLWLSLLKQKINIQLEVCVMLREPCITLLYNYN